MVTTQAMMVGRDRRSVCTDRLKEICIVGRTGRNMFPERIRAGVHITRVPTLMLTNISIQKFNKERCFALSTYYGTYWPAAILDGVCYDKEGVGWFA